MTPLTRGEYRLEIFGQPITITIIRSTPRTFAGLVAEWDCPIFGEYRPAPRPDADPYWRVRCDGLAVRCYDFAARDAMAEAIELLWEGL